jgi:hypothetical protein
MVMIRVKNCLVIPAGLPRREKYILRANNCVGCYWDGGSTLDDLSVLFVVPDSELEILTLFLLLSGADIISLDRSC